MIYQGKALYPVREVVLHCAAINTGQFAGFTPLQAFATVNQWHRERGFASFGYHGLIMPSGVWFNGRPLTTIGAHCIEANRGTIGILLIESKKIDRIGVFSDWFTVQQEQTLRALLQDLHRQGVEKVSGHNDYAPKLCPGFRVSSAQWLPRPFPAKGDNFVTQNRGGA